MGLQFLECLACSGRSPAMSLEASRSPGCKLGAFFRVPKQLAKSLLQFCGAGNLQGAALANELSGQRRKILHVRPEDDGLPGGDGLRGILSAMGR